MEYYIIMDGLYFRKIDESTITNKFPYSHIFYIYDCVLEKWQRGLVGVLGRSDISYNMSKKLDKKRLHMVKECIDYTTWSYF